MQPNLSTTQCFHCGLPLPKGMDFTVDIDGTPRAMCCPGCQAVAQAIVANGLTNYYRYRTEPATTGQELVPRALREMQVYDNPQVQKRFVQRSAENLVGTPSLNEVSLILEGIQCAACVWLNEQHLRALPGVVEAHINLSTQRARVCWDPAQLQLSEILQAIRAIGYEAHPYDPARQQEVLDRERKQKLRGIGVAGVFGMQVMMFATATYVGDAYGMELEFRALFYWICLLLTLPVLLYSARPFFSNAWRDIQLGRAGMDVPVSVGIALAFAGSVWATVHTTGEVNGGHVYYDSVAMFVFLLLLGRYFEVMARQRGARVSENLVQMAPATATRLSMDETGVTQQEDVLVADLAPGDEVLIRPGEGVPADGVVTNGQASVDESILTGESLPLTKIAGDRLTAGAINLDSPLQMRVEQVGEATVLSHILRLLERAQTEKPAITQLADRVAGWFVLGVLLLAAAVAWYWWQQDSPQWLAITLSVLVVTCPCALSLATPAAITAATGTLTRHGLITTRGHALETLARATHFVFDKTGTLTTGRLRMHGLPWLAQGHTPQAVLAIAAALESHSEHPIAQALIHAAAAFPLPAGPGTPQAQNLRNQPGAGLQGEVDGVTYFLGTDVYVQQHTGAIPEGLAEPLQQAGRTLVFLAQESTLLAVFALEDDIRPGARALVAALHALGREVLLLSGDHPHSVAKIAAELSIQTVGSRLSPEDKLNWVKALQAKGAVVAMIGDGVNDAPVLAASQVSIAMGNGTQAAKAGADMILLTEQLPNLLIGIHTARQTLAIIRQNLLWAIGYNVLVLPLAAMGYILPWMAAIGMSASSLLVVVNALRLQQTKIQ